MQRMWSWLAVNLGRRAGLVSLVGLILTIGLGLGITQLEFETGQDAYLNADSQVYQDNVRYQDLFGGQAILTLITMDEGHTVEELFTEKNIAMFSGIAQRLRSVETVDSVIGPLASVRFSSDLTLAPPSAGDATSVAARALTSVGTQALVDAVDTAKAAAAEAGLQCPPAESAPADVSGLDPLCQDVVLRERNLNETSQRLLSAGEPVLTNPAYVDFLIYDSVDPDGGGDVRKALEPTFPDDTHALLITRLGGNLSIEQAGAAAVAVQDIAGDLSFENASVVTTGAPFLLKNINDYLQGGMLTLSAVALVMMALILILFFNMRWRLLPLAVVSMGVIWAFGLTGFAGIPLTLVTIAALPVMLGIGLDFAVQMHSRIEEEVVIGRVSHPIQEAARGLGGPLVVVTVAAVLSFLAILAANTPMIRQFGLLLALGMAAICISSIVNPLAILGIREYKRPTAGRTWTDGYLASFVHFLGKIPPMAAIPLAVLSVGVFVGGAFAEGSLEIQTDPVRWVNQDSQVIEDIHTLEQEVGGSSELGVFVVAPEGGTTFTDETVSYVEELTQDILAKYGPGSKNQRLLVAFSMVSTVSDLTDVPGAEPVTPGAELVERAYEIAPAGIQDSTVAAGGEAMNVVFLTGEGSLEDLAPIVDYIRDRDDAPGELRVTPSGLAVVGVGLLENLTSGRIMLTYLALGLVFVWLAAMFRSIVRGLLAVTPVLIAVGTASLIAYFGGFKLSPMTAVSGPLVIAVCAEFTALILYRYLEERRRGYNPDEAMHAAEARTGRAFVVSGMTALTGVLVIAVSSLPLLRDFGIVVAINIAVALLAALVVLPPLVRWADRRGWVSRGTLDRKEVPFMDVPRTQAEAEAREAAEARS